MKHILFPTDFSETSVNAINFGIQLLYGEQYEIVLLNVYDIPIPPGDQAIFPDNYLDALTKESKEGLVRIAKKIKESHPHLKQDLVQHSKIGTLSQVVKEYIKEHPVDLIVMGTHGASGVSQLLMGSNAFDIIKNIDKPVLSIPNNQKFHTPSRITMALDFKPIKKEKVFDVLLWMVKKFEAKLNVLNVISPKAEKNEDVKSRKDQLDHFLNSVKHEYVFIENESVEEGITEYLERSDTQILAMVIHDLNFFSRLFHPSVTKKIALEARIPLLTVHG